MPSRQRIETVRLYGTNDMSVLPPNFIKMIAAILAYPPFIVQVCFTAMTTATLLACVPHLLILAPCFDASANSAAFASLPGTAQMSCLVPSASLPALPFIKWTCTQHGENFSAAD